MGTLLVALMLAEIFFPASLMQPVAGASRKDWHADSYWHPHWGASGVHKGIDIFARRGTPIRAAEAGLVLYSGMLAQGGKVVLLLSPRGWFHYYAHLDQAIPKHGDWLTRGAPLGSVGNTGNARGKPAHLHYAIFSPIPRLADLRLDEQGWKRMFYRDPGRLL